jgi:hypothetical protein
MIRWEYIRCELKRKKVFGRYNKSINKVIQSVQSFQNTPTPDFNNIKEILKKLNKQYMQNTGQLKKDLQKEFNEALQKRNGKSERLEYNLEILELLKTFAEQNPQLRFSQIMSIVGDLDFYEEPKDTLEKIKKELNK